MKPGHVLALFGRAHDSATISSSDIGAVSRMRAAGGQYSSRAFGTSEPA